MNEEKELEIQMKNIRRKKLILLSIVAIILFVTGMVFYQFGATNIEYKIITEVTTEEKIAEAVDRVKNESGMIVYTIVSESNRRLLHRLMVENHILSVDLFGPIIATMQKFLQKVPLEQPGLTQKINRDYFRMVDAVDFTIKHDDGNTLASAGNADIILIGPSRVGKTPLFATSESITQTLSESKRDIGYKYF